MAWFKKARKPIAASTAPSRVPEGLWVKCPDCDSTIYTKDLAESLSVCPKCSHHFRLSATERLKVLFDDEQWVEHDAGLQSNDPLKFTDTKPYGSRLTAGQKATGLRDAIVVGAGKIDGLPAVVAAMDYGFIGGSMGVVMGEKLVRAIELVPAVRASLLLMIEPALSPLIAFSVHGETPHPLAITGGVLIVGAVLGGAVVARAQNQRRTALQ